jgi:hypothetical protein
MVLKFDFMVLRRVPHIIALIGAFITLCSPAYPQALPRLQQGETYSKQRQLLIEAGWQKVIDFTKKCETLNGAPRNGFSKATCFKYQEHDDCSGNGYCSFKWRNAKGENLTVITLGSAYQLLNWTIE